MKILSMFVTLFAVSANVGAACGSRDNVRALDLIAVEADSLLHKRDFDGLNKLVAEYRKPDVFASDGQPKLMGLYAGLSVESQCGRSPGAGEIAAHQHLLVEWKSRKHADGAPDIALAGLERTIAWNARGGGYASSVTAEGWVAYKKGIEKSRMTLENGKHVAAIDPAWYASMLYIARDASWPEARFDALFSKASATHPYYLDYYFIKGSYYSGTWRGSPGRFKRFVEETVKNTPKMGQAMYARIHWSNESNVMFRNGQTDWKRMKTGFVDMMKHYPDAWNRNNYAAFACAAGDFATVRDQLPLLGEHISMAAWGSRQYFDYCKRVAEQLN